MARTKQRCPIPRLAYAIQSAPQWNEVFGTHNRDNQVGDRQLWSLKVQRVQIQWFLNSGP